MIAYIIKRDDGLYLNEIYQKYVDAYELSEQFKSFFIMLTASQSK